MQACFPLTTKGVYLYTPFFICITKNKITLTITKLGINDVF